MKRPTECLPQSESIKCVWSNHDRDTEDNIDEKKNHSVYVTDESGDTLNLLRLFISVNTTEKINFRHSGKL